MDTTTSFDILVIVLSVMLAIFLLLSIVIMVMLLKVLKHVRTIMAKAEEIADKAEHITSFFERTAAPVALGRFVSNITELFKGKKSKK